MKRFCGNYYIKMRRRVSHLWFEFFKIDCISNIKPVPYSNYELIVCCGFGFCAQISPVLPRYFSKYINSLSASEYSPKLTGLANHGGLPHLAWLPP